MELIPTSLAEVIEIRPTRHGDSRGWFSEVYRADVLAEAGLDVEFVQDNESFSVPRGTVRGIHYQIAPHPQAKLVRRRKLSMDWLSRSLTCGAQPGQ